MHRGTSIQDIPRWGVTAHKVLVSTGLRGVSRTHKTHCVHSTQGSRRGGPRRGSVDLPMCRPSGGLHHGTCQGVGWRARQGSPQLCSFASSLLKSMSRVGRRCGRGVSSFFPKERVSWRGWTRLRRVQDGEEYLRAGRISEACPGRRSVGSSAPRERLPWLGTQTSSK